MFRTELTIAPATGQLPRTARVLTMGSCFADSIGTRLAAHKVETRVNPFGTVFQPLTLARLLRAAAGEDVDWQQHLVQARGRWQSYDLHGSIGADSPVELLQHIQEIVRQTGDFLRNTDVLLLTLGTAWAYRLRETGELVSNCHKQSADLFVRELLTPDEIINALAETHAYLRRINPELRFILTVSPVRHLKDTLPLNSVSKSVLRVATHIVSDLLPGVAYFPAFELITDDLRDYRFYAADMLHPSEVAEDYIWDKFARTYFDADFGRFRKEWAAVRQSLGHRPLHEGAPEHRQFLESTREKLEQLSLRQVDVADELRTVRARLAALPLPVQLATVAETEDDEERIDIGEDAPTQAAPLVAAAADSETIHAEQSAGNPSRPPRLSPEEFRAQRAAQPRRERRDGRGKGHAAQPAETEQFQAASFAEVDEFAQQPFLAGRASADLVPVASATEVTIGGTDADTDADDQEEGRKKKRRSRGGAKRTARKHALRQTAELDLNESQLPTSLAALEAALATKTDARVAPIPTETSPTIPEAPEGRRGRRNEGGRGPARVPLFAVAATPTNGAPETAADSTASADGTADSEQAAPVSSARKNRNRKKKKSGRTGETETADADQNATQPQTPRGATKAAVDQETLDAARNNNRRGNRRPQQQNQPVAALPVGSTAAAVATTPVVLVPAVPRAAPIAEFSQPTAPAPKPSKRKGRAMVGGRTEKPEFDTPIIPVVDTSMVRSQVAAGRLTGTSASLVEPAAPAKPDKRSSLTKSEILKTQAAKVPAAQEIPKKTVSSATIAESKAPIVLAVEQSIPAVALPREPTTQPTKPAKKSKAITPKAPATPKATQLETAVSPATSAASATAKPAAKKAPAKAPVTAKATPMATPQPKAVSALAAKTKPPGKTQVADKPAVAVAAKPAVTPAAVSSPKVVAKTKAAAKAPKLVVSTAEKPASPKKAASKAAPTKAKPAKPAATKATAPKKADS